MEKEIPNPFWDDNCFFCGSNNQEGLKLKFYWDEERQEAFTEYTPERRFTGQGNILHGAIQMGLLDEIMGWVHFVLTGKMGVTTDLNVKFLGPLYIAGNLVRTTCRVVKHEGSTVSMEAALTNKDGVTCTTGTGTWRTISSERYGLLIHGK